MSFPRWSTCSLLCACSLAGALGFFGRHLFDSKAVPVAEQKNDRSHTSETNAADFRLPLTLLNNLEDRCNQLLAQPPTFDRDEELVAAIEKLAEKDPLRAIEQARRQTNRLLRAQLLDAAFHGWGKIDANAAAEWIVLQPVDALDRNAGIASILKGAVDNSEDAMELTHWLNQQIPDQAREIGDALIYAFAQKGDFRHAADFALGGDGQHQAEWLAAAYSSWANYQPQRAAASAMAIADASTRADALSAVLASWAQNDPKGLADFAVDALPEGNQRTHALSNALIFWAGESPTAAADWINHFGPISELDSGRAAIATQQEVMRQPTIAIKWAQSIVDPNFRSKTIAAVVETWSLSNPSGARSFLQASDDITGEDRTDLFSKLNY